MSLFLAYHDSKRALVCSDDRCVSFGENGEVIPMNERVPKFVCVAGLIFAVLGTSDVCQSLNRGFQRMLADHPELTVGQLAQILPPGLASTFAKRRQDDPNRPMGFDNLEAAVIGYDREAKRMRSFVFIATDKFQPVETTANPANRIFALGHYNPTDTALLQRLTGKMQNADSKGLPWICCQLRDALHELHEKYPIPVGEPSFYAALDSRGPVELPADFPPAPEPAELAAVAHHATTNKETAFNGVTRFFLGSIFTPKAGAPDTTGNNDGGSGAQYGMLSRLSMSASVSILAGTGSVSNLQNCVDGDLTTFAVLNAAAAGVGNTAQVTVSGPPGIQRNYSSATLKIRRSVPTNSQNADNGPSYRLLYSTTGVNGTFTEIENLHPLGGTIALSTVSIALPLGLNLSQVAVSVNAIGQAPDTSGQITVNLYEVWIEAVE